MAEAAWIWEERAQRATDPPAGRGSSRRTKIDTATLRRPRDGRGNCLRSTCNMNDANSVWDFLLLMLWFFFLVIWIMILFSVIGDLFRDKNESGFKKFLWCFFLIFAPFITLFVYVIVRGRGM